jgi:anti-anti-sigma factor
LSGGHPLLEIMEMREDGHTRVLLRGELDVAGVPRVHAALRRLSDRGDRVVLDLDELRFIDMSGLRLVALAADDAARDGWALSVTPGSPAVRRLLALVRLDERPPFDGEPR